VVYGARLESGFSRKIIEGSNPSPSAKLKYPHFRGYFNLPSREGFEPGRVRVASGNPQENFSDWRLRLQYENSGVAACDRRR
jgi:hypothetical protein